MATTKTTRKTTEADAATATADLAKNATQTTKAVSEFANAVFMGGRKSVEGIIEVDKALFGYAREALNSYATLGRSSIGAKSVSELFDMHVAHAHDRIEQNAANTREVLDLTQTKAKEAYEPVKQAISTYMPKKDKAA